MDKVYLDYSASTPVSPEVMRVMHPYFNQAFGNPGSVHSSGQAAQAAMDTARQVLAAELGVNFNEIIFTGSATEANDLMIDGIFEGSDIENPKIIMSAIEHESVSETIKLLRDKGAEIIIIPVSQDGFVDPKDIEGE